jgi:hypothetical protein
MENDSDATEFQYGVPDNLVVQNCSPGDVDVVAVCGEQLVRNRFVRPFASGPRPEQLHRVAFRLRPSAVGLQRFVEFVAQIPPLLITNLAWQ